MKFMNQVRRFGSSAAGKFTAGASTLMASGAAFASGGGSPGATIVQELSGGKSDMLLVVGAIAVMLGVLIVWGYLKRTK